jgi:predicted transcriptional regulator
VALTTVATMLNVMRDKKLVKRSRDKTQYLWSASPKVEVATTQSPSLLDRGWNLLEKLVKRPYMYSNLMKDPNLSEADRELIEGLRRSGAKDRAAGTEIGEQPKSK